MQKQREEEEFICKIIESHLETRTRGELEKVGERRKNETKFEFFLCANANTNTKYMNIEQQ